MFKDRLVHVWFQETSPCVEVHMDCSYWIATQSAFGDEPTMVAGTPSLVVPR